MLIKNCLIYIQLIYVWAVIKSLLIMLVEYFPQTSLLKYMIVVVYLDILTNNMYFLIVGS